MLAKLTILMAALAVLAAGQASAVPIAAQGTPEQESEYQRVIGLGTPAEQPELGLRWYDGQGGLARNFEKAAALLSLAARRGDALASGFLGQMYEAGEGVAADPVKAAALYERAVQAGDAVALANLGRMYFNGTGVARDRARGYALTRLAKESGVHGAEKNLRSYAADMTGGEKSRAEELYERMAQPAKGTARTGQKALAAKPAAQKSQSKKAQSRKPQAKKPARKGRTGSKGGRRDRTARKA